MMCTTFRYFDLDIYGKCNDKPCDTKCFKNLINNYRFYIAFENNVCDDYVTEKFYRIDNKIVPIVLRKNDYLNITGENSFIAVDEFV